MLSKKDEENMYDSDGDGDSEGDMDDEDGPKRRRPRVECIMGDRSAEELRNHHPQRITADFKWGSRTVTLTSDFDAGNMCRAEQGDCPNHVSHHQVLVRSNQDAILTNAFLFLVQYMDVERLNALL